MEHDVRQYVKVCKRCVVSKTVEPDERARLESIKTTSPLELVFLDFRSVEDSKGRTVDVVLARDHFTKWSIPSIAPASQQNKLHISCGIGIFAFKGYCKGKVSQKVTRLN